MKPCANCGAVPEVDNLLRCPVCGARLPRGEAS